MKVGTYYGLYDTALWQKLDAWQEERKLIRQLLDRYRQNRDRMSAPEDQSHPPPKRPPSRSTIWSSFSLDAAVIIVLIIALGGWLWDSIGNVDKDVDQLRTHVDGELLEIRSDVDDVRDDVKELAEGIAYIQGRLDEKTPVATEQEQAE